MILFISYYNNEKLINMSLNKNSLRVNYTLEEIKPIILKNLNAAQNIENPYCLSLCKEYSNHHLPLVEYLKSKNIKPSMADKLCFIILLSYPENLIEKLTNISDIKLFTHEYTDFIYNEVMCLNSEEYDFETYDCICSYERLQTIHIVENKYSGIKLQVGSQCIEKYNLISKDEIEKMKEIEKKIKERNKEIKEKLPIGWHEQKRKEKLDEKERKKLEKDKKKLETENKNQEKIKSGSYKYCYLCNTSLMNITNKKNKIIICKNCKIIGKEELCDELKSKCVRECDNCLNYFIDLKKNNVNINAYLCKICTLDNKIICCRNYRCDNIMIGDLNEKIEYCDDCEKKIIKCIDCKKSFLPNYGKERCITCQFNYENNSVNVKCMHCNNEMCIKIKNKSWETYCKECYQKWIFMSENASNCKCGIIMCIKTIIKEGKNKGRKALACQRYPGGCNAFIMF